MTERKRRKKNKVRGERTHGKGDTKNSRGAGNRGGRGNAGANKSKFASIGRLKERKVRLKANTKGKSISIANLDEKIDSLVTKGKIIKEKDSYIIDSDVGFEKILGQGNTNKKLIVRINATKQAITKIKNAKGKFEFNKKGYEENNIDDSIEEDESE